MEIILARELIHKLLKGVNICTDGCWIPEGWEENSRKRDRRKIGSQVAYRWMWRLCHGEIPKDRQINHRCGNGNCVRPSHLYLGTQEQNVQDTVTSHRHGGQNLTAEDVQYIRQEAEIYGRTGADISREMGMEKSHIQRIIRRERWIHVEDDFVIPPEPLRDLLIHGRKHPFEEELAKIK